MCLTRPRYTMPAKHSPTVFEELSRDPEYAHIKVCPAPAALRTIRVPPSTYLQCGWSTRSFQHGPHIFTHRSLSLSLPLSLSPIALALQFIKVNTFEEPRIREALKVTALPTFIFLKNGKDVSSNFSKPTPHLKLRFTICEKPRSRSNPCSLILLRWVGCWVRTRRH